MAIVNPGGVMSDVAGMVMTRWDRAKGTRLGRWLFSRAVGRIAPYSGTIKPRIEHLAPGEARASIEDRRPVRNHLRSIHAAALMNLVELTGSLAVIASLPGGSRMIPVRIEVDFVKKGRGTLTATARCEIPKSIDHGDLTADVTIKNSGDDEVVRARVSVLIGPGA
jgi:acyl-coenzyme A thioesterase PaaI-like protein